MAHEGASAGVGIGFTPFETRTEVILELAQVADAAGYQELGVAEATGHAAPLVLAEAAAVTERMELSSLVLSVWSRSPAVLAMTAMGPVYPRLLRERFGYGAEIDALLAANTDREVPVLPGASRRLAEDVLVLGAYDDIPAAAAMWTDAGADRVSLILPFGAAPEELHAAVLAGSPPLVATSGEAR